MSLGCVVTADQEQSMGYETWLFIAQKIMLGRVLLPLQLLLLLMLLLLLLLLMMMMMMMLVKDFSHRIIRAMHIQTCARPKQSRKKHMVCCMFVGL